MPVLKSLKCLGLATILLLMGATQLVQAQSFDCGEAESDTQWAICNTPELTRMDIKLAILYQTLETAADSSSEFKAKLKQERTDWLHSKRDACGGRVACLKKVYEARISDLQDIAKKSLTVHQ